MTLESLFTPKPLDSLLHEADADRALARSLTAWDLIILGVGGVVGTGVFVITGQAAATNAGPAVTLSFVVGAIAAGLAALCYAELASMIPVAGSAYTYAYATLGEIIAFMIGWDLVLEYGIAAATVGVGWSGYFGSFVGNITGLALPAAISTPPIVWDADRHAFSWSGAWVNLPAVLIILFVTTLLVRGMKLSARVSAGMVALKLGVIGLFVGAGLPFVRLENWQPYIPANTGAFGSFGVSGVFQGAVMVFFAYCGFDAVSCAAQEAKRPQRDVPIGILVSLGVATVLYVAVGAVLTGIASYKTLGVPHPLAVGIASTGQGWLETVIEAGAVVGLASVLLLQLYGQARVFFAMAHDGLLPRVATRVHPVFGTPHVVTWAVGAGVAFLAGLLPVEILGELTSIGTLFAFSLVSIGVMVLRLKRPELPRPFRVPLGPYVVPVASLLCSGLLMTTATPQTLARLFGWMGLGLAFYALYGYKRSRLRAAAPR